MSKGYGYLYTGTSGHIIGVASTLPRNPQQLLDNGWEDITHPSAKGTGHMKLKETSTKLTIGFDKGDSGKNGYRGKDHYHIFNPNATSNKDLYLDENGNPVNKGSAKSHILPKGGKKQ